jgi:hypothetical protein
VPPGSPGGEPRDGHAAALVQSPQTLFVGELERPLVSVDTLLDGVETEADYVTAFADGDYTRNMGLVQVRTQQGGAG